MSNYDTPPRYEAMLLTFWEERNQTPAEGEGWRFRVEDLHTRQKYGFATFDEVVAFLQDKMVRPETDQIKTND